MVTRRKIRRRRARIEAAFWKRFEDSWQKEVSPLMADLRAETFKAVFDKYPDECYEVRYLWREPMVYQPPKGRIFGLIID